MRARGTGDTFIVVRAHRGRCRAFTLTELVLSMGIATLILGGMASALVIASRATGSGMVSSARSTDTRLVTDRIAADLNHAISFTEQTNDVTTFTVPDRDADGNPETIRYAWSGTAGDTLTYQYNGSSQTDIAEDVYRFDLTSMIRQAIPIPSEESEEFLLGGHYNPSGGSLKEYRIEQDKWCAQYFKPTLPTNAISWSITRVYIVMKAVYTNQTMGVKIHKVNARLEPSDHVLAMITFNSWALPYYYAWCGFAFSNVFGLDPSTGVSIVVKQPYGYPAAKVEYHENGTSMPRNTHWLTTSNQGDSWTAPTNERDLLFYVYGTVTTEGPAQWP